MTDTAKDRAEMLALADRMEHHVVSRLPGSEPVIKNGAWQMMLDAAALLRLAAQAPQPGDEAREALEFYADSTRYNGPNIRLEGEPDKYQPEGLYYRLDVTRDRGNIARAALQRPDAAGDGER